MRELKKYIEIGKIINTRGIRGELKIEPWSDSPDALRGVRCFYFADGSSIPVLGSRVLGGRFLLATLEGINTPEAAEKLKGKVISARREEIKKATGDVFICDMIGLPVIDCESGTVYGTLHEVTDGVAQKIYSVKTEKGDVLIPAVPEFIREIDVEKGIFIKPIAGFFDESEEV